MKKLFLTVSLLILSMSIEPSFAFAGDPLSLAPGSFKGVTESGSDCWLVLSDIAPMPITDPSSSGSSWNGANLSAKATASASTTEFSVDYAFMISNPETGKLEVDYSRLYDRKNGDSSQNETLIINVSPEQKILSFNYKDNRGIKGLLFPKIVNCTF